MKSQDNIFPKLRVQLGSWCNVRMVPGWCFDPQCSLGGHADELLEFAAGIDGRDPSVIA